MTCFCILSVLLAGADKTWLSCTVKCFLPDWNEVGKPRSTNKKVLRSVWIKVALISYKIFFFFNKIKLQRLERQERKSNFIISNLLHQSILFSRLLILWRSILSVINSFYLEHNTLWNKLKRQSKSDFSDLLNRICNYKNHLIKFLWLLFQLCPVEAYKIFNATFVLISFTLIE